LDLKCRAKFTACIYHLIETHWGQSETGYVPTESDFEDGGSNPMAI
jgi:hypothetical protein